jgi:hypothetical protein
LPKEIIEKVKKGLKGIENGYFDTGQLFEEEAYLPKIMKRNRCFGG